MLDAENFEPGCLNKHLLQFNLFGLVYAILGESYNLQSQRRINMCKLNYTERTNILAFLELMSEQKITF